MPLKRNVSEPPQGHMPLDSHKRKNIVSQCFYENRRGARGHRLCALSLAGTGAGLRKIHAFAINEHGPRKCAGRAR
jgi:hypothetical protein